MSYFTLSNGARVLLLFGIWYPVTLPIRARVCQEELLEQNDICDGLSSVKCQPACFKLAHLHTARNTWLTTGAFPEEKSFFSRFSSANPYTTFFFFLTVVLLKVHIIIIDFTEGPREGTLAGTY